MKITTWNLRHGGGKRINAIISTLQKINSDILVLTEFRNNDYGEKVKTTLSNFGYSNIYTTNAEAKFNSVLIACKQNFTSETFTELGEHEQRVIKISTDNFTLLGTYFPNNDLKKYVFDFLIKYIQNNPDENIIITGDINTGKHYIDEKGSTFFHSSYFDKLEQLGFVDAWRQVHNYKKEFSWYSNAGNGFRLNHFFINGILKQKVTDCFYDHQPRTDKISDHSAMTLIVDLEII